MLMSNIEFASFLFPTGPAHAASGYLNVFVIIQKCSKSNIIYNVFLTILNYVFGSILLKNVKRHYSSNNQELMTKGAR